ncbi:hypothetical protein BG003_010654 [Podila horticola]|nr:hypothetical protein BG003_010654 [Podila horticola]
MDPSLQEFYSQISIQQPLPISASVQDAFTNGTGRRRRHHSAGNAGPFPQEDIGTTSPITYNIDPLQSDPLQSYRQSQPSYRSSSPYSNPGHNDPYAQDDDGASNPDFPRMEQLEDLDDFEGYSSGQEADPHRSINCGVEGDDDGDEGTPFAGQDQLMYDPYDTCDNNNNVPTKPTPLPKVPLFVLSVVIFSEPLTSTILFPFVYFMVSPSLYIQVTFMPPSRVHLSSE